MRYITKFTPRKPTTLVVGVSNDWQHIIPCDSLICLLRERSREQSFIALTKDKSTRQLLAYAKMQQVHDPRLWMLLDIP